ncbi:hypothetical protein F5Y05DRAFT_370985 [Hypoxylon sp. FL0543]|nr:hypothetical protein F5Y05DRAFT_370985 [Hypoxylon sp. FL0543]
MSVHENDFLPGDEVSDHMFLQPLGARCMDLPANPIDWYAEDNGLLPIDQLRCDPPGWSVNDLMFAIFERRMYQAENRDLPDSFHYDMFEQCLATMEQMVDLELFEPPNDIICLQHPDLFPRNIMVDFSPNITITGILDWDGALFVPRFANRIFPRWLWRSEHETQSCSRNPDEEPLDPEDNEPDTPENAEIKKVFEDTVGDNWVSQATDRRYFHARKLFIFGKVYTYSEETIDDITALLEEWKSLFTETSDKPAGSASEATDIGADSTEDNPEDNALLKGQGIEEDAAASKDVGVASSSTETANILEDGKTAVPVEATVKGANNSACDVCNISLAMIGEKLDRHELSAEVAGRATRLPQSDNDTATTVPMTAPQYGENRKPISVTTHQEPEARDNETESDVAESRNI